MIRPLRQRHRHSFVVLAVFLPVAFALGLVARKPAPVMAALPASVVPASPNFGALEWERAGLFAKVPVNIRLWRVQNGVGRLAIGLSATKDFIKPDLLVYWIPANTSISDTLPTGAILLGSFSAPVLPLPDEAMKANGELVLYSLADNEVVAVSKPMVFNTSSK